MSERVGTVEILQALEKTIDTMKAYHEVNEPKESAIHWIRISGFLKNIILDLSWEADNKTRKDILKKLDKETEDYLHKLTLESLRAKSVQAA